jgi:hypothetical protein
MDSTVRANPGFHLANASDSRHPMVQQFLEEERRQNPYLLEADVNGDSDLDLIYTLAGDTTAAFRVYLVLGNGRDVGVPAQLGSAEWLARGAIFWADSQLSLGELYSDVIFDYRWNPTAARLEPVDPDTVGPFTRTR